MALIKPIHCHQPFQRGSVAGAVFFFGPSLMLAASCSVEPAARLVRPQAERYTAILGYRPHSVLYSIYGGDWEALEGVQLAPPS